MAYSLHLWSAGEMVTAANLNAATYTNWQASAVGIVTTAGDLTYATGANALARLAASANKLLHCNAAGNAPEWISLPSTHLNPATATIVTEEATAKNVFRDVVGHTMNLTIPCKCDVMAMYSATCFRSGGGTTNSLRLTINGGVTQQLASHPFYALFGRVPGLAAGTYVIKVQDSVANNNDDYELQSAVMVAWGIPVA